MFLYHGELISRNIFQARNYGICFRQKLREIDFYTQNQFHVKLNAKKSLVSTLCVVHMYFCLLMFVLVRKWTIFLHQFSSRSNFITPADIGFQLLLLGNQGKAISICLVALQNFCESNVTLSTIEIQFHCLHNKIQTQSTKLSSRVDVCWKYFIFFFCFVLYFHFSSNIFEI